ncbi:MULTISPECIES: guanylate kinase [Psychrobacter]|jgi:guanylate kinase|uniref:guanylate kinase n=1 Tax=Psychrobacter TaxID=497 RepID=UPI000C6BC8D3|nr:MULTISPECIES: guanylate kinase [Psychrobacter]MAE39885.1 guanylate kinase [Psychrobacter sp.]MCG3882715.1 guanylate kinase [Psychrobacter sp. Ps3]|tara:strand:+ start:792 stop:1418 length:627 start_codon:yes stop_codon:yes gene_type:complete
MTGSLFIITAASGTGKTSLVKQLLATTNDLTVSISHTTRAPRPGEIDGHHYHFIDKEVFVSAIGEGKFLEHAEVFGNYYGTAEASVRAQLEAGIDVILEIDWQGALQVKKIFTDATMIFILPPSLSTLRQRLAGRAQDSAEVIEQRLAGAVTEMAQYVHFDYVIINDNFEVALTELKAIIVADRQTLSRQQRHHRRIIDALLTNESEE